MNGKQPYYKRILLKLSGEALMGNESFGIDPLVLENVAAEISSIHKLGVEVAIVIGGVFLLITRVANWRNVVSILVSSVLLAGILHYHNPERFAPIAWHVCAGGLLFGAFFMATDPVTCPSTNGGKWAYGVIIGVVTMLIRNFTGYVEGVMFAILLGNIVAPILDEVVIKFRLRRIESEE